MKVIILSVLLLCLLGCGGPAEPPSLPAGDLFFPETGHTVTAPFAAYYRQHEGLTRLGYPITEALAHEGWQVQYFQYGRLEVHPENRPAYRVTVGWLGQWDNRTQPPQPPNGCAGCNYFPETGHAVSGDFWAYFKAHGDTVQFGRPISEPFLLNGRLAQDFQSARFIWYPHLPPAARVQLEPLGETYFLKSDLPSNRLDPVTPPPGLAVFSPPGQNLPANVLARLAVEETSRPEIIRVSAVILTDKNLPISGYSPRLQWEGFSRALPPTQSAGQTHALIKVAGVKSITFTLYDQAGAMALASITRTGEINTPAGQ